MLPTRWVDLRIRVRCFGGPTLEETVDEIIETLERSHFMVERKTVLGHTRKPRDERK